MKKNGRRIEKEKLGLDKNSPNRIRPAHNNRLHSVGSFGWNGCFSMGFVG